jgi:hypothetical protein
MAQVATIPRSKDGQIDKRRKLVFAAQDVISQPRVCHSTTMAAFVH